MGPTSWRTLAFAALVCVSSAVHGATANPETSLSALATVDSWELTVPVGRATVVVPKGHLQLEKLPAGGATSSPRYCFLVDRTEGETIFAGWLESSRGMKDVAQTLQSTASAELEHLKAAGFGVMATESGRMGEWATVTYTVTHPSAKGKYSAHVRASRVAGDTWIDLHISVTRAISMEECQKAVIDLLRSVTIRLR
jgi:hypothetical protein